MTENIISILWIAREILKIKLHIIIRIFLPGVKVMKKYSKKELDNIIDLHKKWLTGDIKGEKADLSGVSLCKASLKEVNLLGANLSGASLAGANLRGADLLGASMFKTN